MLAYLEHLATPSVLGGDYADSITRMATLQEQAENGNALEQLTDRQRRAIDQVFDEFDKMNERPSSWEFYTNDALANAPEWSSMRDKAKRAVEELSKSQ
ncbi:hypothetical protein [Botrimarina sp.]|uniref:hypothetical protein n=1 Tax=Botrimarina sp. TaxID=2795802 RepID=UPI0032EB313B